MQEGGASAVCDNERNDHAPAQQRSAKGGVATALLVAHVRWCIGAEAARGTRGAVCF